MKLALEPKLKVKAKKAQRVPVFQRTEPPLADANDSPVIGRVLCIPSPIPSDFVEPMVVSFAFELHDLRVKE